jgi:nucleoside-diphosphate-sugar epimerase
LIGATGFIGSQLTEYLVKQGHKLTISIRKSSNLSKIAHLPIDKIELDFTNIEKLIASFEEIKVDYIIYNAGITKAKLQVEYNEVNVDYALNVANAVVRLKNPIKKFIYMSSIAAHGPAEFQNEDILKTSQPTHPVTMYGVSKQKAEVELLKVQNLKYIFLRPTIVYGPNEKDLYTVFKFVNNRLGMYSGDGKQKFSFIFIDDLLKVIEAACLSPSENKCYFVTDGKYYSPLELNSFISQALNKKILHFGLSLHVLKIIATISEFFGRFSNEVPPLNLDKLNEIKAKNWHCDIAALTTDLGITPQIFLEEGITRTVKWYKENNWL